jgi:hypothetical protein
VLFPKLIFCRLAVLKAPSKYSLTGVSTPLSRPLLPSQPAKSLIFLDCVIEWMVNKERAAQGRGPRRIAE